MAYGTKVAFEPIREVAFGGIGAAYAAVGTATVDYTRVITLNNSTDAEVYISFDGVNDHLRLAVNSFKLIDLTTNTVRDDGFFIAKETLIYAKRVAGAPTTGSLWIEVLYGAGGK